MKPILAILTTAVVLFFLSCSNNKKEKEKTNEMDTNAATSAAEAASDPFILIMVQHPVKNFDKFLPVYMAHDSMRKAYGITHYLVGRGLDDPNMVIIMNKIDDVQKAKEFAALPELKNAMDKAGATGPPTFSYVDVVRNDDSVIEQKERVRVAHRVKDFDAWLKAYDAEGKETRAANGLIDRGMSRNVDDPNMVNVVFAVTDMEKAKARIGSEELKKIMTDAGVEGPPQIIYYRLVDTVN